MNRFYPYEILYINQPATPQFSQYEIIILGMFISVVAIVIYILIWNLFTWLKK